MACRFEVQLCPIVAVTYELDKMPTMKMNLPATVNTFVDRHAYGLKNELVGHCMRLGVIVAVLWSIEFIDLILWGVDLDQYGVRPRTWMGLRNIGLAPFLHHGFFHLIANTIPFFLLGMLVMLRGVRQFVYVSILAALISGLGVWIFGASYTVHLGISGVIFGFMGFLLGYGYLERSIQSIVLAVLAFFFYGGMLWGVLPLWPGVSWLGHLFGFIGGALAAYWQIRQTNRFWGSRNVVIGK